MPTPTDELLRDDDRRLIAEHGLDVADVLRQLEVLRNRPPFTRLLRACTPGDGIRVLSAAERARFADAQAEATAAGRFLCFVPASGAASRMFRSLAAVLGEPGAASRTALEKRAATGDVDAREVLVFADGLPRFAFHDSLRDAMRRRGADLEACLLSGDVGPILEHLLTPAGLDYASLPKGLLEFHRYPGGSRTAFEEHLVEGSTYARDAAGNLRLHLTVSPQHLDGFRSLLERARAAYESRLGARFDVGFSHQEPATDTVAVELDGRPFRDDDGRILFRPGGHGALLGNLERTGADLVYIKNIDNIVPDHLRAATTESKSVLGGLLVTLQAKVFAALERLDEDAGTDAVDAAVALLDTEFGAASAAAFAGSEAPERRAAVRTMLERPIRVCGMVRCTGDPGGGPFWVRAPNGAASAQIVETAQIDTTDPGQKAILDSSTHFNPVDLVCALRDHRGRPFVLERFVDPDAVFLAEKSSGGRKLRALEHPGLWNGSMAGWNTVFVEVPSATFNPVKTVNDLLRPQHQPG